MVSSRPPARSLYKSEHKPFKSVPRDELPRGAVLMDTLRALEAELRERHLTAVQPAEQRNGVPLWFLAETERNVFLWRHGYSLDDASRFEFWIDPRRLAEKRLNQIVNISADNPFHNPLWGGFDSDPLQRRREEEYLSSFLEVLNAIERHTYVLSYVASVIREEAFADSRPIILLPQPQNPSNTSCPD